MKSRTIIVDALIITGIIVVSLFAVAFIYAPSHSTTSSTHATTTTTVPTTISTGSSTTVPSSQNNSSSNQYQSVSPCNCSLNIQWPETYENLSALASASLLVAVVNVTSSLTVAVPPLYQAQTAPSKAAVPVTYYNITVIQTIEDRGGIDTSGQVHLSVVQIGGTVAGTVMEVAGYPTLQTGQSYIMFLGYPGTFLTQYYGYRNANSQSVPPSLITTGGPQGLFYVRDGMVYSLDSTYPKADTWLPVKAAGVPVAQFVSEVQAAARTSATA